jgi:hypothetical protein
LRASATRELFENAEFQARVARWYRSGIGRLRAMGQRVDEIDGERPVEEVTAALTRAVADLVREEAGAAARLR